MFIGYMKKIFPMFLTGLTNFEINCETCIKVKDHITMYPRVLFKETKYFNLIHSDVWSPFPLNFIGGNRWFVLFTDDSTRMT
jgi:hypothetical protein